MAISKKLEIIYHNGQPDGIRSIRRHLSTMTTYVIPRPLLSEAKKLSGINRPGIYYLISENDENKIAQIYIGQTRNGVVRLDDHNRSKDFWNKAIMFLADSKTFSLDMISDLEAYANETQDEYNDLLQKTNKYVDMFNLASEEDIDRYIKNQENCRTDTIDFIAALSQEFFYIYNSFLNFIRLVIKEIDQRSHVDGAFGYMEVV